MNEAIKLAIEKGGYDPIWIQEWYRLFSPISKQPRDIPLSCIFTDPLFWVALGKALGWKHNNATLWSGRQAEWLEYAHAYFELVLTDGSTEKFWKELLVRP